MTVIAFYQAIQVISMFLQATSKSIVTVMRILRQVLLSIVFTPCTVFAQNVGINTSSPDQALEVNGKLQVGDDGQEATEGAIRYNATAKDFEGYNGTRWVSLTRGERFSMPGVDDAINPPFGVYNPEHVRLAMDNLGDVIIVWEQNDHINSSFPYQKHIFRSERRNGVWTHPVDATDHISPDGSDAHQPEVAMDDNGNAIITWHQITGTPTRYHIFKSEYRNGAWDDPDDLNDFINVSDDNAFEPAVAMDNAGNAIITWFQEDGSNIWQIFKSEYRSGEWTHPSSLSDNISPNGTFARDPRVAMDDNGEAVIVWRQMVGSRYELFFSEYRDDVWTHPASTANYISPTDSDQDVDNVQVAMNNLGRTFIVYSKDYPGDGKVFLSTYAFDSWTHVNDSTDAFWFPNGNSSALPAIALNDNDRAVLVFKQGFYENTNDNDKLFKCTFAQNTWTMPTDSLDCINVGEGATDPRVAIDNNNDALITWYQKDQSGKYQTFKSELRNGNWQFPANLNDNISADATEVFYPQVVMSDNGSAVIVWSYNIGGGEGALVVSEY